MMFAFSEMEYNYMRTVEDDLLLACVTVFTATMWPFKPTEHLRIMFARCACTRPHTQLSPRKT